MGATDLVLPTHFVNEATRVQRVVMHWRTSSHLVGELDQSPVHLTVQLMTSLHHSALSQPQPELGRLFCRKKRDSKYFRLRGPRDFLSFNFTLFRQPQNFHFLPFMVIFTKVILFFKGGDGGGRKGLYTQRYFILWSKTVDC